ncbi:PIGG-like protein [Mya arenaria]|uniref:PIGG-like protein n=1 Tax=Mya arenaria TaxID=6604 RepID=A0ABY7FNT5_MYAAR|nr:PIGG-like protein [Mya arenaria]
MKWSSQASLLYILIAISLISYVLFLVGFFPLKQIVDTKATLKNYTLNTHTISQPSNQETKVVIVLIDALRSDFVSEDRFMPFVHETLLTCNGRKYIVKAHPPTVTLPRIKALTSGSIPGFVDVVLNFDSRSLTEDNIISQAFDHGKKIVFYGDDTWIKLFPEHFIRSEGTTSFFVTDYTEVDDNVTRHLDDELKADDWDMMILHYLGLDHIGHTVGPASPLVAPKLQEMDKIIQNIYTSLEKKGSDFLVLVCGDHEEMWRAQHQLLQVDLAPTLSVLLGLPPPSNSLGQLLVSVFDGFTDQQKLDSLYVNLQQVIRLMEQSVEDIEKGHMGNSNSLSTVDVSAGYVGLAGYQSTVVGVLLFCSTYAGPGFWLIALVKYHLELGQTQTTDKADTDTINHQYPSPTPRFALLTSVHSLLTERLVTLLFYCVVVSSQRYHLFVWTVFSPKLLYEGMLTLVFVVFALAVSAIGP